MFLTFEDEALERFIRHSFAEEQLRDTMECSQVGTYDRAN